MIEIIVWCTQVLIALTDFMPRLIAFCAVLAAVIPPVNYGFWGAVYKVINALAFNVLNAKNAKVKDDDA